MEKALYLFCLARAGSLPELLPEGLNGGTPISTVNFGNISAVVSEVPLNEYSGDAAESNLQDLAWVGPRALRHAEIIESVASHVPVLPSRFGTLFSSKESLQQLMERNSGKIDTFFDAVWGKDEWSVKVLCSRALMVEKLISERLAGQSEALAEMNPGLRYFKERQLRTAVEKEFGARLRDTLSSCSAELARCSNECRQRKTSVSQEEGEMTRVADWAFLVDREAEEDFAECVNRANAEHNRIGLVFKASGPWPPYSFTPTLGMEEAE
ncbi:MAG: GvpL/GvpF family gas vesicle protein [Pseudomonadota bacterium]